MQADGVGERNGNAHPVPGVFLVVGGLVPVGHLHERLDEHEAVLFIVKVIQELFQVGQHRKYSSCHGAVFQRREFTTEKKKETYPCLLEKRLSSSLS